MDWIYIIVVVALAILIISIAIHRIRQPLDITFDIQDQIKDVQVKILEPTEPAAESLRDLGIDLKPFSTEFEFTPEEDMFMKLAEGSEDKEINISIDCGSYFMLGKTEFANIETEIDDEGNSTLIVQTKRSNWWKVKKPWLKRLLWVPSNALRRSVAAIFSCKS